MQVVLISPEYNYPIWSEMYPNGALALLKAVAQDEGAAVYDIQMVSDKYDIARVLETIEAIRPSYIGVTFTTFQTKSTRELCRAIKERFDIPIIAGGAHVSSIGEPIIKDFPDIDYFVAGEGETIFREILQGKHAPGFIRACGFENLDETPMPDYSWVDLKKFTGAPPPSARPSMFMMASRGCPSQCTFCNKAVYGSNVRYKSPERVIKELKQLHKMGAKEVFFQDDTLNLNYEWLDEILDRIQFEKFGMVYRAPFRANEKLVHYSLLKKLKDTGFWLLFYGVESGDEQILKSAKKGMTIPEIERAFRLTKEAGIKTEASFIVGLPGENHQTVHKSFDYTRD
jgi:anaerobic magnesium-protoporphyrin IX monomethyl ester cyclase